MRAVIYPLVALLTGLLCQLCCGAEIVIKGPTAPIQPGAYVILQVDGLTDADLAKAVVEVTPAESVILFPAKTWGGNPIVIFSASVPGKYQMMVSVNRWKQKLTDGTRAAEQAQIEQQLLQELQVVVTKIDAKYPARAGACVVEVAGTVPPPQPPIPPDPPVVEGKRRITILYETSLTSPALAAFLVRLRDDPQILDYLKSKGHSLLILDRDTMDENNQPIALIKQIKEQLGKSFPSVLSQVQLAQPPPVLVVADSAGSVVFADKLVDLPTQKFTAGDISNALAKFLEQVKKGGG